MHNIKKFILIVSFILSSVVMVSACNTVEGLGQDTRALGDAITGASRDSRGY